MCTVAIDATRATTFIVDIVATTIADFSIARRGTIVISTGPRGDYTTAAADPFTPAAMMK